MTLSELRPRLRAELGDETTGVYVWSDALLDGFLGDATERLGEDLPLEKEAQLTPNPDGAYALPADLLRLRSVATGGVVLGPGEYTAWGGTLRLASPGSSEISVRYAGARPRPPASGDAGLLAGETPPVLWLAAASAMGWLGKQREKAGAASSGAVASAYGRRYEEWLRARRRPLRRVAAL